MPDAFAIVQQKLDDAAVAYTLHHHVPIRNAAEAIGKVDFPFGQFLKTIVFSLKNGGWILAALHPSGQVDYRALATVLGVKRGDLRQASPEEVEEALGFMVGGVCPIPTTEDMQIVYDEAATRMGIVYCGSGRNDYTLEIAVTDLMKLADPLVAPISRQ